MSEEKETPEQEEEEVPAPKKAKSKKRTPVVQEEPADESDSVRVAISKHGTAEETIRVLLNQNRQLVEEVSEAKAAVPSENSIILDPDDAKKWKEYLKFGAPEKIQETLAMKDTEASKAKHELVIQRAAILHNYDAEVLTDIAQGQSIRIQRPEKAKEDAAFVVIANDKGEESLTLLPEWLKTQKPKYLPALERGASANRPPSTPPSGAPDQRPLRSAQQQTNGSEAREPVNLFRF